MLMIYQPVDAGRCPPGALGSAAPIPWSYGVAHRLIGGTG
jgi:hypothetical protein